MTPQELLLAVADHFEAHPETWTQGEFGRDRAGDPTLPYERDAVCWCVSGMLFEKAGRQNDEVRRKAWDRLFARIDGMVTAWNDAPGRTVAEVIAKLREAAA